MNPQFKIENGKKIIKGIEWTDFTWNPIGGCQHGCRWEMPDGTIAECYAETTAEGIARNAYPKGFEHHYWRPHKLNDPLKEKTPSKIFIGSMADIMGTWVTDDQIKAILDTCDKAHWHEFQLLTKNAPRLLRFEFPKNVWLGVSSPPTYMFGKQLTREQQDRMIHRQLDVFDDIIWKDNYVTWMSIEPLSFDITATIRDWLDKSCTIVLPLEWAVIGAASRGKKYYQPEPQWVENILDLLELQNIPPFFKGNLDWLPWLEGFPHVDMIRRRKSRSEMFNV